MDVARKPGGVDRMLRLMEKDGHFACPVLAAGKQVYSQTPAILQFLGPRLGLAPRSEAGRLRVHQLQLTLADWLVEVHDVHHPIGSGLYYEEQKKEARRRARDFLANRLPRYLDYFEGLLRGDWLHGKAASYADLSLFQMMAGLDYAFPRSMARLDYPRLRGLQARVAARPRLARYLASKRRIPFNRQGIFRHYPELDGR